MAKDPAFLFYPGDWLGGTMTFTRSHKGAYMDLLMAQFNNGHMSIDDIQTVLGADYDLMWESKLVSKFKQDESGYYYNEKLESEIIKRREFTASRNRNLKKDTPHMRKHMKPHMERHMENENENRNIKESFNLFWKEYPKKKSKGDAERAFKTIKPDEQLLATMIAKIEQAKKSEQWLKDAGQFIPYPATWLRAKGWEDEYTGLPGNSGRGSGIPKEYTGDGPVEKVSPERAKGFLAELKSKINQD